MKSDNFISILMKLYLTVQEPGSIRVTDTARDPQSVDGEEVNMPSSDTETVGCVSDVSIDTLRLQLFLNRNLWWTTLLSRGA